MEDKLWRRNQRGIMEEASGRRTHGEGIVEKKSWRINHGGIMEEES